MNSQAANPTFQKLTAHLLKGQTAEAERAFAGFAQPELLSYFAIWAMEHDFADYALRAFAKAAASPQANPGIYLDWTNSLLLLCRYQEALEVAQIAVEKLPRHAMSQILLAMAYERLHDLERSLFIYRQLLDQEPENAFAHHNYGCTLLLAGEYRAGWPEHEWRLVMDPEHQVYHPVPRWTGQHRQGRGLLVYTEQGFGDTLQFCRFLALIDRSQGPIYLTCPPQLEDLMRANFPDIRLVGEGEQLSIAWQVGMMSLPAVFGLTEAEFGGQEPYLRPTEIRPLAARGPKIGLVWSSGKHTGMGIYAHQGKSIPLAQIAAHLPPGASYYSLQTGAEARDVDDQGLAIEDLSAELTSFGASAARMVQLDLLITVDTASAHLAGAMGVQTWVFLPFAPNWRWQLARRDTPWYADMRLYRPQQPLDWSLPLAEMGADLRRKLT